MNSNSNITTTNTTNDSAVVRDQQHRRHSRHVTGGYMPRTFRVGTYLFHCTTRRRLIDTIIDWSSYLLEGFVYLIGPALILLALGIVSLLSYTFFGIVLPMMYEKHTGNPYRILILIVHSICVLFLLSNVLFNYAACVLTKHTGPAYDQVIRELAQVTDFPLPQSPEEMNIFRQDLHDRLVIRLRRRREYESTRNTQESSTMDTTTTLTRRNATIPASSTSTSSPTRQHHQNDSNPHTISTTTNTNTAVAATTARDNDTSNRKDVRKSTPIRNWMLMGPYEWGYDATTNQPKPPRSHYDNVSKALVLNLDHYCPWMFNASK